MTDTTEPASPAPVAAKPATLKMTPGGIAGPTAVTKLPPVADYRPQPATTAPAPDTTAALHALMAEVAALKAQLAAAPVEVEPPVFVPPGVTTVKGKKVPYQLDWVIATVRENPKKGASRYRYAVYRPGMTIEKYITDERYDRRDLRADINWDLAHGFITVMSPADYAASKRPAATLVAASAAKAVA